jgi:hypothetical protein
MIEKALLADVLILAVSTPFIIQGSNFGNMLSVVCVQFLSAREYGGTELTFKAQLTVRFLVRIQQLVV